MPALTLNLNRLVELFAKSVNNDKLPVEIRSFSAKLMTLTAHVIRIDGGASKAFAAVNKQLTDVNAQIAQLTEIVSVLAQRIGVETPAAAPAPVAPAAAQPKPSAPPVQTAAPMVATPPTTEEEVDEEEEAAVARLIADTQAEVDAINGAPEVA